jgi:phosphoglycerate dehydrogenase-like enzyme
LDNVVLLPPIGGGARQAEAAVTAGVLQNLDEYLIHGTLAWSLLLPAPGRSLAVNKR